MLIENKIESKVTQVSSKIWYGNPQIELTEGSITYDKISYVLNNSIETDFNDSELEFIKQYIWESNIKNNLIKSHLLCCINVPNKISINELLTSIQIYLSYIVLIRVLKSPIPNYYFIYLQMKNQEYSNIFFNTFHFSKINPFEKDYLIFAEVNEISFEEIYNNGILKYLLLDLSARSYTGIKALVSPIKNNDNSYTYLNTETQTNFGLNIKNNTNTSTPKKCDNNISNVNNFYSSSIQISKNEFNTKNHDEFNVCPICLDYIDLRKHETTGQNYYNSNTNITGVIQVLCGHMFHIECCLKLDDDKCPLCRFNLSPSYVSTCTLCTCENDLWMCLVCGSINCGEEGGSSNHRKEHYINSGHIYARGIGETHNITFDFSHNSPLHTLFRNTIISENFQDVQTADYSKNPKEKVEYIVSEYNSIISSQLESQRIFYLNMLRKIEDSYNEEDKKLDEEIQKKTKELKSCEDEMKLYSENKISIMARLKNNDIIFKNNEKVLIDLDLEYNELIKEKQKFEDHSLNDEKKIKKNIEVVSSEIEELQNQIKEMNIHIKTLNKVKNKNSDIAESSIDLIINNGGNRRIQKK